MHARSHICTRHTDARSGLGLGLAGCPTAEQAVEEEAAEAAGETQDKLAIAVTASAVEAVATGPQEQLSQPYP